jgi:hypothetical protein
MKTFKQIGWPTLVLGGFLVAGCGAPNGQNESLRNAQEAVAAAPVSRCSETAACAARPTARTGNRIEN